MTKSTCVAPRETRMSNLGVRDIEVVETEEPMNHIDYGDGA